MKRARTTAARCRCKKCAAEFEAGTSTAETCPRCRAIRDALALREHTATCTVCGSQFYRSPCVRWAVGKTRPRLEKPSRVCIDCRTQGIGAQPLVMKGACVVCNRNGQPELFPGAKLCVRCVQDPGRTAEVTALLLTEQRKAAERGHTTKRQSEHDIKSERTRAFEAEVAERERQRLERVQLAKSLSYPPQPELLERYAEYLAAKADNPDLTIDEWVALYVARKPALSEGA